MPDPTTEAEIGALRNRIAALEANGAELLARAERAEAEEERMRATPVDWDAQRRRADELEAEVERLRAELAEAQQRVRDERARADYYERHRNAVEAERDTLKAELTALRTDETDVDWLADHVRTAVYHVLGRIDPPLDNKVRDEASERASVHIRAGSVPFVNARVMDLAVDLIKEARAEQDEARRDLAEARAAIERVRDDLIAAQRSTGASEQPWLEGIQAHVKRAVVMLGVALDAPQRPEDTREETGRG